MTWQPDAPFKSEVSKCRIRLLRYCVGVGLDVGFGGDKIRPEAIGVDQGGKADINCDISRGLGIFADNFFDYIFSSHCLEDFEFTEPVLADWWKKIKVGGHLVLYLPHKDLYPNIGTIGCNVDHRKDFTPEDVMKLMDKIGTYEVVRNETHNEADEYSFDLVLRKTASEKVKLPVIDKAGNGKPKALVIRYGAFGDHVIATPLVKRLHEEGYHVTYNCTSRAFSVIANSPYIDNVLEQEPDLIPGYRLEEYWDDISKGYDKVINLSESLECKFLFAPDRPGYHDPIEKRREASGQTNYYDYALQLGGFNDVKSPRPEMYPTKVEEAMGQYFKALHKDVFVVMWALAGSSMHKCYPFGEQVALEFLNRHKDAMTITVGDDLCRLIEWDHPRAEKKSAVWDIRSSMLATKYVDLVIAPETGILNASGCYNTPKIGLLTHSNKTNLTKYFANDYSMQAEIDCSPCHRMIYQHNAEKDCPKLELGDGAWLCACAGAFDPNKLLKRMEMIYAAWKEKNRKVFLIRPEQAIHDFGRLKLGDVLQSGRASV